MFREHHKIEVMTNESLINKAPKSWSNSDWINYYKAFQKTKTTPVEFARSIWGGYSFTPVYKNGRRKVENFTEAWHMAFDFDNRGGKYISDAKTKELAIEDCKNNIDTFMATGYFEAKIEDVTEKNGRFVVPYQYGTNSAGLKYLMRHNSFAWHVASFAYATPSSLKKHPKSRVVFIFDTPITSAERFQEIYQAIAWRFAEEGSITDKQCSDPLRLYYGSYHSKNAGNWAVISDNEGSTGISMCQMWIDEYKENLPPEPPKQKTRRITPDGDTGRIYLQRFADNIRGAGDGERNYQRTRNAWAAGGYVASGHIDEGEAINVLVAAARSNSSTPDKAEAEIIAGIERGKNQPLHIEVRDVKNSGELL